MLEELQQLSRRFLTIKNSPYRRYLIRSTDFSKNRMSLIAGQRGVGKTTTLVQKLLDIAKDDLFSEKILYVQADHFQIAETPLYEIAKEFVMLGGRWIAFDEIHKYPEWSKELKSIYDTFPDLHILASGSSALEIHKGSHDLSRRAIRYFMQGMSFREFLELSYGLELPSYSLDELCHSHEKIAALIIEKLASLNKKAIPLFNQYQNVGYYPYFHELSQDENLFKITLEQNVHTTIESDLAAIFPHLTGSSIKKIKQLLVFIAHSVPMIPNWKKMSDALDIKDNRTLKTYIHYLEQAGLIRTLTRATKKFVKLEAPEKIYLNNPNQLFAISSTHEVNKGSLRETFFLSMTTLKHTVAVSKAGDFVIDDQYVFEVGGKNKGFNQIKDIDNSYIVSEGIELGVGKKIPLWLFGFLC